MEKITLKPIVKELLYKNDEVNTYFDVFTYLGATTQERALGSLCLIGHIKYSEDEEDLGYVISLVSSLAKREYYSEAALKQQDPKKAFEQTLKKLNEVLADFFKNKQFILNIGLASIAGDQIYLSKLGKFKVGLARNGEHIDVLNNIALFQKSSENEQQFSNIISGKLQPGDKLFAYYPSRPITSREKMLQVSLVREPQGQFVEKIAQLAGSLDTFSCCGVHIEMDQIKEIPLEMPSATATLTESPVVQPVVPRTEKPRVIAAELSVAKKDNVLRSLSSAATKLKGMDRLPIHARFRGFIIVAAVVLVPLLVVVGIRATGDSSEVKAAYRAGIENLKMIQTKLAQSENREARALIMQTLTDLGTHQSDDISKLTADLEVALNSLDRLSTVLPSEVANVGSIDGMVLAIQDNKPSVIYNGSEKLMANGKETTLQDPVTANAATLYEGNLYTLAGGHVYKYADAVSGSTKRSEWGVLDGISLAVDGNLYVLGGDGKISMYFKGEKKSEFDPGLPLNDGNQIATISDSKIIYLANPATKRLYALDKETGALQTTYNIASIGDLQSITPSGDGVMLFSKDGRVWSIAVPQ